MSQTAEELADVDLFLEEARRFLRQRLEPLVSRPESLMTPAQQLALTNEAIELGLLPAAGQEPGFGLWEQPDEVANTRFSLGLLELTAAINAGISFSWHRYSLAIRLARQAGLTTGTAPLALTLHPTGHFGLGRSSLARWLAGKPDPDDQSMLADWLDRHSHPATIMAPQAWQQVIWPVWQEGEIEWQLVDRSGLIVGPPHPQHGLNELSAYQVHCSTSCSDDSTARAEHYDVLLAADALGLSAIALGLNSHGDQLALDYASLRRQGGDIIRRHPAVQQMLADIQQAGWQVRTLLDGLAGPANHLSLPSALMIRTQAHTQLGHAANQVMQVHGGIGYMQDCGPEKLLRDQNTLRSAAGGIRDIPLFVHAWQEVHS